MALLFMEGFDSLAANNGDNVGGALAQSGWVEGIQCFANSQYTREGRGFCLALQPGSTGGTTVASAAFASPLIDHCVLGFAINFDSGQGALMTVQKDNLAGSIANLLTVFKNGVGGLSLLDGAGGLIAASDNNVIFPNQWNYLEIKAADGVCMVKVNGCVVINAAIDDSFMYNRYYMTKQSFGGQWNGTFAPNLYDDFYLEDGDGETFTDFLGDVVIEDLRPISDAGPNELIAVGVIGDHFQAVDEIAPDETTTYLMTDQTNKVERYEVSDTPDDVIDVLAVAVSVRAKRDGTGFRTFRPQVTLEGITIEGNDKYTSTGFVEQTSIFTVKPGGGDWSPPTVDAMQIGFRTTVVP